MHYRRRSRKKLSLGVKFSFESEWLNISCLRRTRDIGLGGVFVYYESCDIPVGEEVSLSFTENQEGAIRLHRLEARVSRVSKEGVGLVFQNFDTNSFCWLLKLMSRVRQPSSSIPKVIGLRDRRI